ncbi:MAG: hypothetical protein H6Q30_1203 [Bacteroidetes bacterium]|jgi:uncharacterized protein (DUF362 family)|nr:hypothetical protein [Bacteroidota bacterium]
MDRREFIRRSVGGSIVAGSAFALGDYGRLLAATPSPKPNAYDLVAVKGGEPDDMFDSAIEALGGIGAFVKKGQKVLVKPNIGWDVTPERGGNTHPKLVSRLVQHCLNAGAKEVYVFDHTCDNWIKTYKNSGVEKAAKDAGAKVVSGESESYYHEVDLPKGKRLTKAKVHELLLSADVFINAPILKHHSSSRVTIGLKNSMGMVWDRGYWHRNDLHQCIADFGTYRKPDLTVVDAYYVMKQNGPRGVSLSDVLTMKSQIVATDPVAADAAAAKIYGVEPRDIPHIAYAEQMGLGKTALETLNIKRIKL